MFPGATTKSLVIIRDQLYNRGNEKNLSTFQASKKAKTWFSPPFEECRRQKGAQEAEKKGS
jgi:hypothetical protein